MLAPLRSLPRNYLFLAPICAIALVYQVAYTVAVVDDRLRGTQTAGEPLLTNAEDQISLNSDQARKAGLQNGERLLSIDGVPVKNVMSEEEILRGKKPGDRIQVVVQGLKDKVPTLHSFKLEPAEWRRPTVGEWGLAGLMLLMSLLSVGIGTYVALRLPQDPSAVSYLECLSACSNSFTWSISGSCRGGQVSVQPATPQCFKASGLYR
jgi:hypothetical protein